MRITHLILLYSSVVNVSGFHLTLSSSFLSPQSQALSSTSIALTTMTPPSHQYARNNSNRNHRLKIGRQRYRVLLSSPGSDGDEIGSNDKVKVLFSSFNSTASQQFTTAHITHHHTAIKTRNITNAINFYSLLGFQVESKFVSGQARAAWLIHNNSVGEPLAMQQQSKSNLSQCRIELIEVPSYMLNEPEGTQKRAINLLERPALLGLNHVALDVTRCIDFRSNTYNSIDDDTSTKLSSSCDLYNLQEWIDDLNTLSIQKFGKSLRVAVSPTKRIVGREVYEMAFVYDTDGSLVELLNHSGTLEQEMDDGWIPWDGQGFVQ